MFESCWYNKPESASFTYTILVTSPKSIPHREKFNPKYNLHEINNLHYKRLFYQKEMASGAAEIYSMGYQQVLNLVNIQTSALTLRTVSHSGDRKLRFLFRFFSDLITIYSYFMTTFLIIRNIQHSNIWVWDILCP